MAVLLVALFTQTFGAQPGRAARTGFITAVTLIFALFLALAAGAVFAPQQVQLKSDKSLVAAASAAIPDAQLYSVGDRSFSAEFYSGGRVQTIGRGDFLPLAQGDAPAAFSVPTDMATQAQALGLENLGEYGRHILFVTPRADEVK